MDVLVSLTDGELIMTDWCDGKPVGAAVRRPAVELATALAERERESPRWVWADTDRVYPAVLAAGGRVARCHDLRLAYAIVRGLEGASVDDLWSGRTVVTDPSTSGHAVEVQYEGSLLDGLEPPQTVDDAAAQAEYGRQLRAVERAPRASRLRLLLAAESAGALVAAEMKHHGLPWSAVVHDEQLTALLGPRPPAGQRPAKLEALADQVRLDLRAPGLNPDSQTDLLRALRSAGLSLTSTRRWELERLDHPVVEPLVAYKRLSRLLSANGWAWLDAWVHDGRFHPDYVVGGVVTGRWATSGGGALQLPRQVRAAVVADPGHRLVVADAAQLEPRILAAMTGDEAMAAASRRGDLYQALVDTGVVDTRAHAKVAMLGALYGATSGQGGLLMPRLTRAYPQAIALVEQAARDGELGRQVSTWLGRRSPLPSAQWREAQRRGYGPDASAADERRARARARDWGRFTRNFVVQGTAAEWALCWMADLRTRLHRLADAGEGARLVYFLHDEVIVHTPAALADEAADAVRSAAASAARLLFGDVPVDFPVSVATVRSYAEAKE